jgi:hypothetical protein
MANIRFISRTARLNHLGLASVKFGAKVTLKDLGNGFYTKGESKLLIPQHKIDKFLKAKQIALL